MKKAVFFFFFVLIFCISAPGESWAGEIHLYKEGYRKKITYQKEFRPGDKIAAYYCFMPDQPQTRIRVLWIENLAGTETIRHEHNELIDFKNEKLKPVQVTPNFSFGKSLADKVIGSAAAMSDWRLEIYLNGKKAAQKSFSIKPD